MVGESILAFVKATKMKIEGTRGDLEGPNPSPTERHLVDCIATCWLRIQEADTRFAQTKPTVMKRANFYLKRQVSAHERAPKYTKDTDTSQNDVTSCAAGKHWNQPDENRWQLARP